MENNRNVIFGTKLFSCFKNLTITETNLLYFCRAEKNLDRIRFLKNNFDVVERKITGKRPLQEMLSLKIGIS